MKCMDQSLENILEIHSFNCLKNLFFGGGGREGEPIFENIYKQNTLSIEKGYVNNSKVNYQIKATHLVPRKAET